MSARRGLRLGALVLVLGAGLAALLWHALGGEPPVLAAAAGSLERLQILDARLNLDTLQARLSLRGSYDPLVRDLSELDRTLAALEAQAAQAARAGGAPPAWAAALPALRERLRRRSQLVEDFKSSHAVLRNSVQYLPELSESLATRIRALAGGEHQPALCAVDQALRTALEAHVFGDERASARVPLHLDQARAALAGLGPDAREVREDLDLFALHSRIAEARRRQVAGLLPTILSLSEAPELSQAAAALARDRAGRAATRVAARVCALLYVLLLLGGGAGLLWRLRARARQLDRHNELLEARVRARTAELEQATEAAQSASRMKSQFLANMSHEIRTPLNAVIGLTDLCLGTELSAAQREHLSLSKSSAESLLVLLNDLLDFSKIEAGHLELEVAPFAPRPFFEELVRALAPRARSPEVALRWSVSEAVPPYLAGDRHRLRQVVVNLLGNALKFTERGEVALRADWIEDGEGAALLVSVADTGIGIPPEKLGLVFEAFQQADGSTTRRFGGTGLGLSIARQLLKLMGGRIWAESAVGRGTTFHVRAPLSPAQAPAAAAPPPAPAGAPLRVLVVEDNPVNQLVARRILERGGHTVLIAGDGQQAVDACQRERFDVILMDLQMPVMDGLSATAAIRALPPEGGGRTPIIAMTANAMKQDEEACQAQGMDGFLCKPVRADALLGLLAAQVPAPRGGAAAP